MSELSLLEQAAAIQEQIVTAKIEEVKFTRHKTVASKFALDILPIVNPFEQDVIALANALVQLDGNSAGIIDAHNVRQVSAVALKNDAAKNPDRWSQDPAKVQLAEQRLYGAEQDIARSLSNNDVNAIAAINQEIIDKTSSLSSLIQKRDGWDNARANYTALANSEPLVDLDAAIMLLRVWAVDKDSGEVDILDIAKATGLSFRQTVIALEHILDVFAPTNLISTTYIR